MTPPRRWGLGSRLPWEPLRITPWVSEKRPGWDVIILMRMIYISLFFSQESSVQRPGAHVCASLALPEENSTTPGNHFQTILPEDTEEVEGLRSGRHPSQPLPTSDFPLGMGHSSGVLKYNVFLPLPTKFPVPIFISSNKLKKFPLVQVGVSHFFHLSSKCFHWFIKIYPPASEQSEHGG